MSVTTTTQLREALKGGRPVMRGPFEDYDVENVLQALSISRQLTAVELYDNHEQTVGWVYLKSGMVLAADAPIFQASGLEAFQKLMHADLGSYCVYRLAPLATYPVPIGRLSTSLLSLKAEPSARPTPIAPEKSATPTWSPTTTLRHAWPPPAQAAPRRMHHKTPLSTPVAPPARPPAPVQAQAQGPAPAPVHMQAQAQSTPPRMSTPALPPLVKSAPQALTRPPIVAIASPKGGCGKTTISLNLAVSLARQGLRVVLVDVDPNGDVLSAIAARDRVNAGIYEAVIAGSDPAQLLLRTVVQGLSILPAIGPDFSLQLLETPPTVAQWRHAFRALSGHADIILVDCPAGVTGVTAAVLQACTHVVGVLQAEVISKRSFSMFERGLAALTETPAVLGVVLNMFQRTQSASVTVFIDAAGDMPAHWLFDTTIPRANDFLSSSDAGLPLRIMGENAASAVTWLFDMLAGEVRARLGLADQAPLEAPTSFLL